MTGTEIKSMIKASGLRLWQVAQALGINDGIVHADSAELLMRQKSRKSKALSMS